MYNKLAKKSFIFLFAFCGLHGLSNASATEFQVEIKPLPLLYNLQDGWSGYGGDIGVQLTNKWWFTTFFEFTNSNFSYNKQSTGSVVFTGHDLNLIIAKTRYFFSGNGNGWIASAGVLSYDIDLNYYDGKKFTKTIDTYLPNVGFGYQHKFKNGLTYRIEAEISVFLDNFEERKNLPATSNNPSGTQTLLGTLQSPVLPGLDMTIGYIF